MSHTVTVETMQEDHRQWREAHCQWRRDIDRWQAEHEKAIARLAEMQKVVREHGEALADHSQSLRKAEEAVAKHESEIASYLAGASRSPQDVMANNHQAQEGSFAQHKRAHERIRKHHQVVLAQLENLEKAAAAAM